LETAYRQDGYAVQRLDGGAADLELERDGLRTLVSAKRWKVARTGVEPLRGLAEAGRGDATAARVFIVAGELSAQARAFAAEKGIRIVEGAELVALMARAPR